MCFNGMGQENNISKEKCMAKKKVDTQDKYYFLGALVVVAIGFVVLSYLLGVQHTLNAIQPNLPF
jgi:hypothetical protein